MKYRKLLTSTILTSAICLLTVLAFTTEKAEAWGWFGFSVLRFEGTLRGQQGDTLTVTLKNATINVQCYNTNTGNFTQPGRGNSGLLTETVDAEEIPGKVKGIVSVDGSIDLSKWDNHGLHDDNPEDHLCWPFDNINKVELPDSAWIQEFEADWVWKNDKGKVINEGTDRCEWTGEIVNGIPDHEAEFECDEESLKKIKWVVVEE